MKSLLVCLLLAMPTFASSLTYSQARELIFKEIYNVHRCDEPEYATKTVCSGEFLDNMACDSDMTRCEVDFEYEYGQMLSATVYEDGTVDYSYWSTED